MTTRPVDVIANYLTKRRLSNSAEGGAYDLDSAGLLAGGWATIPNPVQAAANLLGCRMSWPDAAGLAEVLDAAGMLVQPTLEG